MPPRRHARPLPSDLTKFTRCAHATSLDLADHYGVTKLADRRRSLHTDLIVRKGMEFEQECIERLALAGNCVLTIPSERRTRDDLRNAEADTLDAMRAGNDCIYRAVFFDGRGIVEVVEPLCSSALFRRLVLRLTRRSPLRGRRTSQIVESL